MVELAKPGGVIVLGLYNVFARLPHRARRAIARATGFRVVPFDPVLRARDTEPERRRAWFRDQYEHPEEHRHTLGEVQSWFRENGVEYLRTYPNALLGAEPLDGAELFEPAEDDWWLESLLAQIAWSTSLASEGGLWVMIREEARGVSATGCLRHRRGEAAPHRSASPDGGGIAVPSVPTKRCTEGRPGMGAWPSRIARRSIRAP